VTRLRSIGPAAALCVAGALVVLLGASLPWLEIESSASPLIDGAPTLRAARLASRDVGLDAVPALGLVALAGAGALLAVRGVVRRVVAGLLVAAALTVVVLTLRFREGASMADVEPRALGGRVGGYVTMTLPDTSLPARHGSLVALAGAVLLGVGGVVALGATDGRGLGSRFDSPTAAAAPAGPADVSEDGTDAWNAIDRGEDPTTGFTKP
jgi:uncharacterized membrane protein (TIGR02234 family)